MTTTTPSAALIPVAPVFTNTERLALAGFLAGYSGLAVVRRSSVLAALSALPARQREVVVLRYYADLSEAQIAAAMGISTGAVKSHIARAKDSLRAVLRS
jgi:DNA-directed RNA polymerase specialized sigma24 family protein